jgi:hypothetical protein
MRLRRSSGFTAVELVAVIAVTIVVATICVAAIRTYVIRKQVDAGLAMAAAIQDRVESAFRRSGVPPADWRAAGFPGAAVHLSSEYVERIDIIHGRIEIIFGGAADAALSQRTLSLTPFETADMQIVWLCGDRAPGVGLKPLGFAGGSDQRGAQVDRTIATRYLPANCD